MKTIEMIVDAALPDFEQKDGLVVSTGSIDLTRRLVSLVASASLARSLALGRANERSRVLFLPW